jgi:hypothetical protein
MQTPVYSEIENLRNYADVLMWKYNQLKSNYYIQRQGGFDDPNQILPALESVYQELTSLMPYFTFDESRILTSMDMYNATQHDLEMHKRIDEWVAENPNYAVQLQQWQERLNRAAQYLLKTEFDTWSS